MIKKVTATFDKWMKDPKIKKDYKKRYNEFILSEFILAAMEEDNTSVRVLAKKAGISPTVVQNIRSGKQKDMKIGNFVNVVQACGYNLVLEKGKERIPLSI
jgi:lambda repressor-like predicted transcriptional regulator